MVYIPGVTELLILKVAGAVKAHAAASAGSQALQAGAYHVSTATAHHVAGVVLNTGAQAAVAAPTAGQAALTLAGAGGLAYGVASQQGGLYGKVRSAVEKRRMAQSLQEAVSAGDEKTARELLDDGAEMDESEDGEPSLWVAAREGHIDVVRLLLEKGASVHTTFHGRTVLLAAVLHGHEDIAWLLIHRGADVDADQDYWGTALQAAAFHGNAALVRLLIDKRAWVRKGGGEYGCAIRASVVKFKGHKPNPVVVALLMGESALTVNVQITFREWVRIIRLVVKVNSEFKAWRKAGKPNADSSELRFLHPWFSLDWRSF